MKKTKKNKIIKGLEEAIEFAKQNSTTRLDQALDRLETAINEAIEKLKISI